MATIHLVLTIDLDKENTMVLLSEVKECGTTGILKLVETKQISPYLAYNVLVGRFGKTAIPAIEFAISETVGYKFKGN